MKRLQLMEIEDQDWCPRVIRDAVTDYLQFTIAATKPYAAMVPILASALQRTGTRRVLDLCSGAGGPWLGLHPALAENGVSVPVSLTDKFPNMEAFGPLGRPTGQTITYHPQPVDATRVPIELSGFRTMFTAFHHFRPEQACAVLADAIRLRQGIGVFEVTQRRVWALLLTLPAPLVVLLLTPLLRPFRWSRLLRTYHWGPNAIGRWHGRPARGRIHECHRANWQCSRLPSSCHKRGGRGGEDPGGDALGRQARAEVVHVAAAHWRRGRTAAANKPRTVVVGFLCFLVQTVPRDHAGGFLLRFTRFRSGTGRTGKMTASRRDENFGEQKAAMKTQYSIINRMSLDPVLLGTAATVRTSDRATGEQQRFCRARTLP
jgi:hypothetical protein